MRLARRSVAVALVVLALLAAVAEAATTLSRRHAGGRVTVVVTLTAPPVLGAPLTVKVTLDTHSVSLDGVDFVRSVVMRKADGRELSPTVESSAGGGHHRQAVLVFPPVTESSVFLVVKGIDGVAERPFVWEVAPQ